MAKVSPVCFVRAIEDEGMDTHRFKREGNQQVQIFHVTEWKWKTCSWLVSEI